MNSLQSDSTNLNAAYPHIVERLKSIEGVKRVKGVKDLDQVLKGITTGSDASVYLVFDGISDIGKESGSNQESRFNQLVTVEYGVLVSSQTYDSDGMPKHIGELLGAIMVSLSGFEPAVIKDPRVSKTLTLINAGKPWHSYEQSVYPLKFKLQILITGKK